MVEPVGQDPAPSGAANGHAGGPGATATATPSGRRSTCGPTKPAVTWPAAGRATSGEMPVARGWRSHAERHGFGASDFEVLERSEPGAPAAVRFPRPDHPPLPRGWTLGTVFERALLCDVRVAGERHADGARRHRPRRDPRRGRPGQAVRDRRVVAGAGPRPSGGRLTPARRCTSASCPRWSPTTRVDAGGPMTGRAGIAERPPLVVRRCARHVQALPAGGARHPRARAGGADAAAVVARLRGAAPVRAEDREPRLRAPRPDWVRCRRPGRARLEPGGYADGAWAVCTRRRG